RTNRRPGPLQHPWHRRQVALQRRDIGHAGETADLVIDHRDLAGRLMLQQLCQHALPPLLRAASIAAPAPPALALACRAHLESPPYRGRDAMTPEQVLAQAPRVLTQAQRERYFETGFLAAEGLVPREWLARLVAL